jgi:phenylpropionate dioxygenase-like ring-hydroxylating dioxygenase large terminal subunit
MALTETWSDRFTLRPDGVPKARYTSADFARLEAERLWPKVWQMACRSEEIPEPGDYTVYDILDQSVLLMRQEDGTVKAFHNFCPHRGTQLADGTGTLASSRLVCPFHGWSWSPDGANTFVLDAAEFCGGSPSQERVGLRTVPVAEWLACVWINLDPEAPPFEDHVASIRGYVEPLLLDQMRVYWWNRTILPANWKIAQEAFLEGYHTPGTHPQLGQFQPDGTMVHQGLRYDVYDGGHSTFRQGREIPGHRNASGDGSSHPPGADPSAAATELLEQLSLLYEGMDAMVLADDIDLAREVAGRPVPDGSSAAAQFMAALYGRAATRGQLLPAPEPEVLGRWGGEAFIFPNTFFLPQFANCLAYRARPNGDDPDSCIFEVWSLTIPYEARTFPRPVVRDVDPHDETAWREIPLQDFSNIPRIQRGLHSHGFDATILAEYQEKSILHVHQEIDRYLRV